MVILLILTFNLAWSSNNKKLFYLRNRLFHTGSNRKHSSFSFSQNIPICFAFLELGRDRNSVYIVKYLLKLKILYFLPARSLWWPLMWRHPGLPEKSSCGPSGKKTITIIIFFSLIILIYYLYITYYNKYAKL